MELILKTLLLKNNVFNIASYAEGVDLLLAVGRYTWDKTGASHGGFVAKIDSSVVGYGAD